MDREEAKTGSFRFSDVRFAKGRFSIGVEIRSGRCYRSMPVADRMVDYEEYYGIDADMSEQFMAETGKAVDFVDRYRRREEDARLFYQPGVVAPRRCE
jgi:hypothetical protein